MNEEKAYRIGISQLAASLGFSRPRTMWRHFYSCKGAGQELRDSGFEHGKQKELTSIQMKIICERIGYPE